ncbi:MAG: type I-C CRISPR-associated protein Cas7/Csd2 [Clostridia bacterium]|nr:type I-C CRISPR-associated protein Cas7/Csd2 [Clostridia bacterium]
MELQNKIDFMVFVTATDCNPNGDPLNGNRPRTRYDGYGEISDVCIKRKIRNRLIDLGQNIFVQSDDKNVDGYKSLSERALAILSGKDKDADTKKACETWIDVRSFGQVFAFKGKKGGEGVSIPVRGPVTVRTAVSCSPVDVNTMQITKSVNSEPGEGKSSDTMGTKHRVGFGLYKIMGSINVQLAEKTGFSEEDAELIKQCLKTLFINDVSSARPDGSMEVVKMLWWQHNCKEGQYSSAKVHNSVSVTLNEGVSMPKTFEDYTITVSALDGLSVEEVV